MPEPLTLELVLEMLKDLNAGGLGRKMDDEELGRRAAVYRQALEGLSGDAVRFAIKKALQEDEYFPKPARIRMLGYQFRRETATPGLDRHAFAPAAGWCPGCRTRARDEVRWRPRTSRDGWIYDERGRLALEPFGRLRCLCDAPPQYVPDAEDDPFMTLHRRKEA
jgi:hypothetical protein